MTVTINLGLARNDGEPDNTIAEALIAVSGGVEYVTAISTAKSETEKTLVVQFDFSSLSEAYLYNLCEKLAQDCIAVRNDATHEGTLVGPNAAKWGAFNPKYFLEV